MYKNIVRTFSFVLLLSQGVAFSMDHGDHMMNLQQRLQLVRNALEALEPLDSDAFKIGTRKEDIATLGMGVQMTLPALHQEASRLENEIRRLQ